MKSSAVLDREDDAVSGVVSGEQAPFEDFEMQRQWVTYRLKLPVDREALAFDDHLDQCREYDWTDAR